MTERDDQTRLDIREKAKDYLIQQKRIKLVTKPSIKFPRGARYGGYLFDVTETKIVVDDLRDLKRYTVFISEIASPSDIWEDFDND